MRSAAARISRIRAPAWSIALLQALAEVEVTAQEMIEYQPEIAFGVGPELKTEGHPRGACRQSRRPAACPSAPH